MKTTLRALLAVGLLLGFYVLAAVVLLVLLAGNALLVRQVVRDPIFTRNAVLFLLFSLVVGAAILRGIFVVSRRSGDAPEGISVSPRDEPVLWATVKELAHRVSTRPPDELRLVPVVNAAVSEETRLLGLSTGLRRMYVGLPLLLALTVDQMRAVLAHELGHYSRRHTRLGALTYRGTVSLVATIRNLGPKSLVGRLFKLYAALYFRVSQGVNRRQELEADAAMVEIAGRRAAATALRELDAIDSGWQFFLDRYVLPSLQAGFAPADLFSGFRALIAEPSRQQELERIRNTPRDERSPYDSHPSMAERLAAIERHPDPPVAPDSRPAIALLTQPRSACWSLQRALFREDGQDRTAVEWDELAARAAEGASTHNAALLLHAAERVSGARPAVLGTVLDVLDRGEAQRLSWELQPADPEWSPEQYHQVADAALRKTLGDLVACALVSAGRARWRLSWAGLPYRLIARDGKEVDPQELVGSALSTSSGTAGLRNWLHAEGVPLGFRVEAPKVDKEPQLLGVVFEVVRKLHTYDVLVFDVGLLMVRVAGLRGLVQRMAAAGGADPFTTRVQRYLEVPPQQLGAAEGNLFIPDSAILDARIRGRRNWRLHLQLADGTSLRLRRSEMSLSTKEAREVFARLLGPRLR